MFNSLKPTGLITVVAPDVYTILYLIKHILHLLIVRLCLVLIGFKLVVCHARQVEDDKLEPKLMLIFD